MMNKCSKEWLLQGSPCWLGQSQPGEFLPAVVIALGNSTVDAQLLGSNQRVKVSVDDVELRSKQSASIEKHDLVGMDVLNEPEILMTLRTRYLEHRQIYTLMGQTLIAVNPYHRMEIYGEAHINSYRARKGPTDKGIPHAYEIARQAELSLKENLRNQAVLITGESGAGKTETLKYLVEYLCFEHELHSPGINEKIIACNPILEAFGNASTSRNSNSSRFGKFIKLYYTLQNRQMKLVGAEIENYLLEKTRVSGRTAGESNFHIFGMLRRALSSQQKLRYRLNNLQNTQTLEESDQHSLSQLLQLFKQTGFSEAQIDVILRIVAAILNMAAVSFIKPVGSTDEKCSIGNPEQLVNFSELLGAPAEEVGDQLLNKRIIVGKQSISSPLRIQQCSKVRDGLCKNIYEALFDSIVQRLNCRLNPSPQTNQYTLGLLDIFGFESFRENSLEQLFINYANERLQQIYVQSVFKSVQEDMLAEKVDPRCLQDFNYSDNSALLARFDKPPHGLFDILQDSCSLAKDDDESFLNKVKKAYPRDDKLNFSNKANTLELTISHTASPVTYNVSGFRTKNMDIRKLELSTSDKMVAAVLHSKTSLPAGSKFVSAALRKELSSLTETELLPCDLFFVRCIKPNQQRTPFAMENAFVAEQVRYLGILEAVRVRKQGYSEKVAFSDFAEKYAFIIGNRRAASDRETVVAIEAKLQMQFQKGAHKLFLKAEQSQKLRLLFLAEHSRRIGVANRIGMAYIRYRQRAILKHRLAVITGSSILSRLIQRSQRNSLKSTIGCIKSLALRQKATKAAKVTVLKQSLKQNIDLEKQPTHFPPQGPATEERKIFRKQETAATRIAHENIITQEPAIAKVENSKLPIAEKLFESHQPGNTREPERISRQLSPSHHIFVQPQSLISTGVPNKQFHCPIVQELLLSCESFEGYCRSNLFFKYPKDKDAQLEKLMSYRNKNLSHAMLSSAEEYLKEESDFAFRCILKIVGERKSRYSQLDHLNHLASLMMGTYHDKDTGLHRSIIEEVKRKKKAYQSSGSTGHWSASQYSSVALNTVEDSIVQKPSRTAQALRKQYEAITDSPLCIMRDEVYIQIARQMGGHEQPSKLKYLKDALELLTRYFPPSKQLILPYLRFMGSQKGVKDSLARSNLLRFAECYSLLDTFFQSQHDSQPAKAVEALQFLKSRKSELGKFELQGKMSLSVVVYDKAVATETFSNETLLAVKKRVVDRLGLQSLQHHYSLWHSLQNPTGEQGHFIDESAKVVDYVNGSLRLIDELSLTGKKDYALSLGLRIKYYFPFQKSQPSLLSLVYYQVCQQFKDGRFDLGLEEEAKLASLTLYLQRGAYSKQTFRLQWLSQFRGISEQLAAVIQLHYSKLQTTQSASDTQSEFLNTLLQSNPYLLLSHEFSVTLFEVERSASLFKKSTVGEPMLMIVKPSHILLVDIERKKSYERIDLSTIDKWGLSKGKSTCLILQTIKNDLKILASEQIHTIEEMISEYVSRLAGQRSMVPSESILVRET